MNSIVIIPKTIEDFQEVAVIAAKYQVDVMVESVDNTKEGIRYIVSKLEWAPVNYKECSEELAKHFNIIVPEKAITLRPDCYIQLKHPFSPVFFGMKMVIFGVLFYAVNF